MAATPIKTVQGLNVGRCIDLCSQIESCLSINHDSYGEQTCRLFDEDRTTHSIDSFKASNFATYYDTVSI